MHDFWLLREGERRYDAFWDLLGRTDAPVRVPDDALHYLEDSLAWVPTLDPSLSVWPAGYGLNWTGPTIINQTGGALFQRVCTSWADLFAHGPEQLRLRGLYGWPSLSADALRAPLDFDQMVELGEYEVIDVDRDWFVQTLRTLAAFGERAASGEHFILHLGI